jgi:hypothetical protein
LVGEAIVGVNVGVLVGVAIVVVGADVNILVGEAIVVGVGWQLNSK